MKMPRQVPPSTQERSVRLKAALQANIARRKQAAAVRQEADRGAGAVGDADRDAVRDGADES